MAEGAADRSGFTEQNAISGPLGGVEITGWGWGAGFGGEGGGAGWGTRMGEGGDDR